MIDKRLNENLSLSHSRLILSSRSMTAHNHHHHHHPNPYLTRLSPPCYIDPLRSACCTRSAKNSPTPLCRSTSSIYSPLQQCSAPPTVSGWPHQSSRFFLWPSLHILCTWTGQTPSWSNIGRNEVDSLVTPIVDVVVVI